MMKCKFLACALRIKEQKHTYQMNPKFLVNAILCAQPPDSMTS